MKNNTTKVIPATSTNMFVVFDTNDATIEYCKDMDAVEKYLESIATDYDRRELEAALHVIEIASAYRVEYKTLAKLLPRDI